MPSDRFLLHRLQIDFREQGPTFQGMRHERHEITETDSRVALPLRKFLSRKKNE